MVWSQRRMQEVKIHSSSLQIKVGQRLAYWALAKTYGKEGFLYAGPLYKSHQLKENVVEITFEHGSDGLIPENQKLRGFELVDEKGNIVPAEAEIINGSARVKVWNDSVPHPVEVRYCFRNYMEGDLSIMRKYLLLHFGS